MYRFDWLLTLLRLGIPAPLTPALVQGRLPRTPRRRRRHAPPPPETDPLDDETVQFHLALVCLACF